MINLSQISAPNAEQNYQKYVCEYPYGGQRWMIEFHATSREDAAARLKAIGNGEVLGEFVAEIPAELGWFAKLSVWIRNLIVKG